ncbi:Ig-like domain-containing protein, partial [Legionella sp.]|uniref:Ig-like domain-containing protein n=1 Tax=Legionella sp. TaxID=459 RepID=UPI003D0B129B
MRQSYYSFSIKVFLLMSALYVNAWAAAPTAPIVSSVTGTSSTGYSVTGTGEPDTTVQVKDINGTVIGVSVVQSNSDWVVNIPSGAIAANEIIGVTLINALGDASAPTFATTPPDPLPPSAPVISSPVNNSTINTPTTTFSGTGEPGATVHLFNGADHSNPIGSVTVASNGTWSVNISLPDGSYSVTANQTDLAGNTSPFSTPTNFTVSTATGSSITLSISTNVTHFALPGTPILYRGPVEEPPKVGVLVKRPIKWAVLLN